MMNPTPDSLILASGSPRRVDILLEAGYQFLVIPSEVEELHAADVTIDGLTELCEINAKLKADDIAAKHSESTVIGADTLVYLGSTPLGKPSSEQDAFATLQMLSGKTHHVCTGIAVIPSKLSGRDPIVSHQITEVTFKKLNDEVIRQYMDKVDVLDKAGSYAIQDHGEMIIESVHGDFDNVVGLPQTMTESILHSLNVFPRTVREKIPKGHRYPLLFNPHARSQRGRRALRFLLENAQDFVLYATRDIEDAQELTKKFAAKGEPVVLAAGGDGTLNAVIQSLVGSNTALGVLPAGTMNVFARELGIPVPNIQTSNLDLALDVIKHGYITNVDLFEVNQQPFVQMAGVGFDAQVIEETSLEKKKLLGPLAYLMSAAKVLGDHPPKMKVTLDDGTVIEGVAILAGNGELYGGQVRLFPGADNTDGLLDILIFKESGYKFVLDSIKGIAGVLDLVKSSVKHVQAASFTVESERDVPMEIDGEYIGRAKKATFSSTGHKLKVLAPREPAGGFTKVWKDWVQNLPRKIAGDR